jgi:hypothetical protein
MAKVKLPLAIVNVSPELVVFALVSGPHHSRLGEPEESHSSTPLMVVADMLVTVTATLEAIEPPEAEANVTCGAPVPEV